MSDMRIFVLSVFSPKLFSNSIFVCKIYLETLDWQDIVEQKGAV